MSAEADKRGGPAKGQRTKTKRKTSTPISGREFNYAFQLSDADSVILSSYHDTLVQGTLGYAETAYNYFFDNPDSFDALYAYERSGGNIGEFLHGQINHILGLLSGSIDDATTSLSEEMGRSLNDLGFKPVMVLGCYWLLLDHLHQMITKDPQVKAEDRKPLTAALIKMIFRDASIANEAYWRSSVDKLTVQHKQEALECTDEMLAIPESFLTENIEWLEAVTVEILSDFANFTKNNEKYHDEFNDSLASLTTMTNGSH